MILNLIIDTVVLRRKGIEGDRRAAMDRLAEENRLVLHIPQVVQREYVTDTQNRVRQLFKTVQSSLSESARLVRATEDLAEQLNSAEIVQALLAQAMEAAQQSYDDTTSPNW